MKLKTIAFTMCAIAAALIPAAGIADTPGRHPAYLHARTDLRTAQFFMRVHDEPNVTRNLDRAAEEVEAAIHEIDHAAVLDAKDLEDHPRIDSRLPRNGRFRKIVDLLRSSRRDLSREEDNGRARGWRDEAYRHKAAPLEHVHPAAVDLRIDHDPGF